MDIFTHTQSDSESEPMYKSNDQLSEDSGSTSRVLNGDLQLERIKEEYFSVLKRVSEGHIDFHNKFENVSLSDGKGFIFESKNVLNDSANLIMPPFFNQKSSFFGRNLQDRVQKLDPVLYADLYYDDLLFHELK